jgi:predicted  nucleic acid-binding Zn-ribbon protein
MVVVRRAGRHRWSVMEATEVAGRLESKANWLLSAANEIEDTGKKFDKIEEFADDSYQDAEYQRDRVKADARFLFENYPDPVVFEFMRNCEWSTVKFMQRSDVSCREIEYNDGTGWYLKLEKKIERS